MIKFSGRKMINEKNTSMIPKVGGVYRLYGESGKRLYVGISKKGDFGNLRHRISSYHQKDNFKGTAGHPEKKELRKKAKTFDFVQLPIKQARAFERKTKHDTPYNRNHVIQKKLGKGKVKNFFIAEQNVKRHKRDGSVIFKKSVTKRKGLENFFG